MHDFSVDKDISKAKTISKVFYNSPDVFEQCKEKIFASGFQFLGCTELVKENTDVYPFILLENYLDEALLLTRDNAGLVHLLSNVCTHRGNIVAEKACKLNQLRCRYHGRKFQLDGKFISMPEFKEVQDFPSKADDLSELELFQWGNWLFTSLEKKFSEAVFFKDMMERVSWMPLDKFIYRPELSKHYHVKAHWALYCENYLEGFHIPFVHSGLNTQIDYSGYATELFFPYSSLQLGISKTGQDCFDLPVTSPDHGKMIAAYYFWVFPNMMFNFYPWGLSVNVVQPQTIHESKISFYTYVWDESKLNTGAGAGLDRVEREDEEIVENVQKGVRSRYYQHGRYSVKREQGTHHFHRIIAEFMKSR